MDIPGYRFTPIPVPMENLYSILPREFFELLVISLFSLIIGLSQKALRSSQPGNTDSTFGTDRTFTFIGILGYIFWISDESHSLYLAGLLLLVVLFAVNYYFKIRIYRDFGLTSITVALITYALSALLRTQPFWLFITVYVILLVLVELKDSLNALSKRVEREEFITLGKFLAIAGIVLPIVPDTPIVSFIDLTPYRIWLAVVIISSISYLSYLLRKFVFHDSGVLVTGILGGLYSSTATTFVLARQDRESTGNHHLFAAGMILATSMMYLRICLLLAIFNFRLLLILYPWLLLMFLVSLLIAGVMLFIGRKSAQNVDMVPSGKAVNPLEFRIAIIFTLLFVAFSFITYYTLRQFGGQGLQVLSYLVGFTDIDPFLVNLFNGHFGVDDMLISVATLQAVLSNNLLKLVYGLSLSSGSCRKLLIAGFVPIILISLLIIWLI